MHQRQREIQAALHAARVPADAPVGGFGQPDPLEQRLGTAAALRAGQALERGLEHQMLAAGEDRVQCRLLKRGTDLARTCEPWRTMS